MIAGLVLHRIFMELLSRCSYPARFVFEINDLVNTFMMYHHDDYSVVHGKMELMQTYSGLLDCWKGVTQQLTLADDTSRVNLCAWYVVRSHSAVISG
jgi:hypothetical protein